MKIRIEFDNSDKYHESIYDSVELSRKADTEDDLVMMLIDVMRACSRDDEIVAASIFMNSDAVWSDLLDGTDEESLKELERAIAERRNQLNVTK